MNTEEPTILRMHSAAAPEPALRDVRPGRTLPGTLRVVTAPATEEAPPAPVENLGGTPGLVDVRGGPLTTPTWDGYIAWRKTKCRPYDYQRGPALANTPAPSGSAPSSPESRTRDRAIEEIDQAVLELIGEVAELGELCFDHGPVVFWGGLRDKLIDECGDILFCACWVLDSWGHNPLAGEVDLELVRAAPDSEYALFAGVIASYPPAEALGNQRFTSLLAGITLGLLHEAQTRAGLLANSFKKLKYQRRPQDVEVQVGRVAEVLLAVNKLLILAGATVGEAIEVNRKKLDARYPVGYVAGQGGGNRTGEGR